MGRSIEELSSAFDSFLAKENGGVPNETNEIKKTPESAPIIQKKGNPFLDSAMTETRHPERVGEKSLIREKNFGVIDQNKYSSALSASLQRAGKVHEKQISSADKKIYYNEVLWEAVKMSQQNEDKKIPSIKKFPGEPEAPKMFMLKNLAGRLKKKYEENYREPGDHFGLDVSIYSAVGSDLEKEKGVVAIVEFQTHDSLITDKFYVTTSGYKRDINKDVPMPSYLNKNFQDLGIPSISLPIPFDGFAENDLITVRKDNLPNKICDDASGKILSTIKHKTLF